MNETPYPLVFEPVLMEKVWGGRRLASLGKTLINPDAKYGESWELADMGATSASGAGGGAVRSVIANGGMRGKTIHEAMERWGEGMLGDGEAGAGERAFPLLIKFLDASENLSVQVHPSPAFAAVNAGAHLKTECWYILAAEPGAMIYKGVKPGVTRQSFEAKIGAGTVVEDLVAVPAVVGECHNLPSGTVHALGAGVVVAEVQTPSDTTYRVFDWGRKGRELHVRQAMECIAWSRAPGGTRRREGERRARLVTTEYFCVDEVKGGGSLREFEGTCVLLIVLEGNGQVVCAGASPAGVMLTKGATVLVPAACVHGGMVRDLGGLKYLLARVGAGVGAGA